ncbi:single-stranded DNA-binding protein [Desulforhabdus sp. TSK]|uniref:single-stranded DNA-binding protein n=1 Tax=Desulforhabdus sp. TSK TaxID=2925014 RepID=UPI001FC8E4FB|nr:single-stranded DNA-binding protein [Desulforhabdus sp. TSK]GKT09796.1 single-stranded DNA-binding protein 1 [Desulforhabdus sp. TSK]
MINSVTIAGNLGQDPDIRYTQSGLAIANLNIAVNEFAKGQNGEMEKRTHWFRATAFGRTAEIAVEYLKKGSKVCIAGQLVQRSWQDQSGNNRSSVEIRINQLELLGGNGAQESQDRSGTEAYQASAQRQAQQHFNPDADYVPTEDIPF